MKGPVIAVSIGCPAGIGPEVSVVAASRAKNVIPLLVGDPGVLARAMKLRGIAASRLIEVSDTEALRKLPLGTIAVHGGSKRLGSSPPPGRPSKAGGAAQLAWIDDALALVRTGAADAMATAPVSKSVIASSGAPGAADFRGHTEYLAEQVHSKEVVMAFWSEKLVTSLVTTHLPLSKVPRAIQPAAVSMATFWLAKLLVDLGAENARVVVASLNPHAGEDGLLGSDEARAIVPGLALARARLEREGVSATLSGPLGAETAFRRAASGGFDGVVAMYHDQATIPMKVLSFGDAVNVTLGLPIVRTSVDHGTAYDIAGTATADADAMEAALRLAGRLARPAGPSPARSTSGRVVSTARRARG